MSCNPNAIFIQKRFGHDYHQHILQMSNLGIYTGLPKSTPKLSHPCRAYIITKGPHLPHHPNVSTENLDKGTRFNLDFSLFNKFSCQKFTSSLTIVDDTTRYLFGYITRSKRPPLQFIRTFICFFFHHGYNRSIFHFDEGRELYRSADSMQICIDLEVIVDTTGGYASLINGKVEHSHQAIKIMVCIKPLSCGHRS